MNWASATMLCLSLPSFWQALGWPGLRAALVNRVVINQLARLTEVLHAGREVTIRPDDITLENALAGRIPHVRTKRVVDHDVVMHAAIVALAEFDAAGKTQVVVYLVVARTVVQVDIPTVVATPAIVANDNRLMAVPFGHRGVLLNPLGRLAAIRMPEAIAPPTVERAVVAGLLDRVEYVIELDQMSAEGAPSQKLIPARGQVVNTAISHRDRPRHADIHRRRSASRPGRCDR